MNCKNCGKHNLETEKFCKACGYLLNPNTKSSLSDEYIKKAINPNMKNWSIISILFPIIVNIYFLITSFSTVVAISAAMAGLVFAYKGRHQGKTLSQVGYLLNIILVIEIIIFGS